MTHALLCDADSVPPGDDYWQLTRRPLNCLLFLVPLLLLYEYGVQHFGNTDGLRNGADTWMRSGLGQLGLEHRWLLPALLAGGLLIWQIVGKYYWRIAFDTYLGMFAESVLFGLCLVAIGYFIQYAFRRTGGELLSVGSIPPEAWKRAVGFVGAGIYEEFLFRLCLLPLLVAGLRVTILPAPVAIALAVVANSALFSAAHYVGPAGEPFEQFSFLFRAVAGSYFAVLCLSRGFGITVGAHAAYDLLVGLSLAGPAT